MRCGDSERVRGKRVPIQQGGELELTEEVESWNGRRYSMEVVHSQNNNRRGKKKRHLTLSRRHPPRRLPGSLMINNSLSLPLVTKVGPSFRMPFTLPESFRFEATGRPFLLFHAVHDSDGEILPGRSCSAGRAQPPCSHGQAYVHAITGQLTVK